MDSRGRGMFGTMRLPVKFAGLVVCVLIFGFSLLGYFFIKRQERILLSDLETLAVALATNLASNSLYGLVTHDAMQLKALLQSLSLIHDVKYSWIEDSDGNMLASWGIIPQGLFEAVRTSQPGGQDETSAVTIHRFHEFPGYWIVSASVFYTAGEEKEKLLFERATAGRSRYIGRVNLVISLDRVERNISDAAKQGTLIVAVTAALAIIVTFLVVHIMVRPILALKEAADQVRMGHMPSRVHVESRDEIGELAAAFNRMVDQVVGSRKALEEAYAKLEEINQSLESQVALRTKELRQTIEALEAARDETEAAYQEIKHLYELKQSFLRTASHELRTPLTAIKANVDFILEYMQEAMDGELREMIGAVARNTENMRAMVEAMLTMVRLEAGSMPLEMKEMNLSDKVSEVVAELRALQQGRRVELDIPPDLKVRWDPGRFHDLCLNLLSNAYKFTSRDGRIEIRARLEDDQVVFMVSDDGVGIAPEDIDKIFEPFYQSAHGREGSGLGLAIVRAVVERHGGNISVTSKPGEGTTFIVTMPRDGQMETGEDR